MTYSVATTPVADRDLDALFDFLFASHLHFGDNPVRAFERAAKRVENIKLEL